MSCFLLVALLVGQPDTGYIGRADTIGGTTYDWQNGWGAVRTLVNSPRYGLHAAWLYSADTGRTFPDRNARYNFYDAATRTWHWIDPDYMQSGVNLSAQSRIGFGNIAADDSTGILSACAYEGSPVHPLIAREVSRGSGLFEYCVGPDGYLWPVMAMGDDGTYHVALSDEASHGGAWYSRVRTWCNWDTPTRLGEMDLYAYSIAASRAGPVVCLAWADGYGSAFYRLSTSRGDTWGDMTELEPPPAFGGDTVTQFSLFGLFPFIDAQGTLHFVAGVYPVVRDTAYVNPAEIWHWCGLNQPAWAEVHRAGCDPGHMQAPIGYNAGYAGRPSMGQNAEGRFFVSWEQFDSSNVESVTNRLRAGIWVSSSQDNGATWEPGQLVTARNTASHRFPCIVDRMLEGGARPDTVVVLYVMDLQAGFFVQGEGNATFNPVVCQFVPAAGVAVTEPGAGLSGRAQRLVWPNPASHSVWVSGKASVTLFDAAGRFVSELRPGANRLESLAPGVYFVRRRGCSGSKLVIRK